MYRQLFMLVVGNFMGIDNKKAASKRLFLKIKIL